MEREKIEKKEQVRWKRKGKKMGKYNREEKRKGEKEGTRSQEQGRGKEMKERRQGEEKKAHITV